jgi:hypothetical protein
MFQKRIVQVVGGLLLIAVGILALFNQLGFLEDLAPAIWALIFAAGGVIFLSVFFSDRRQWWPLIPGAALIGLGLTIFLATMPGGRGELGAVALFLCLSVPFLYIYLLNRRANWWAVIPGGAMLSLALMILVITLVPDSSWPASILFLGLGTVFVALYFAEIGGRRYNWWTIIPAGALYSLALVILVSPVNGELAGGTLFLGLGVTFGVLYLMRARTHETAWAWIPALALLIFGAFIAMTGAGDAAIGIFWGLALLLAGGVLLFFTLRRQNS